MLIYPLCIVAVETCLPVLQLDIASDECNRWNVETYISLKYQHQVQGFHEAPFVSHGNIYQAALRSE